MQGPCFCRPGLLSQCVAVDYKEQVSCRFFIISGGGNKCMYRNEQLNNHCWQPEAQSLGLHSEEEVEVDLVDSEEGWGLKNEKRTCVSCTHYTCTKLMGMSANAIHRGGLTHEDLESIAMGCGNFDNLNEEEEITL